MLAIHSKRPEPAVVAVSTLDTKGPETAYLAERIRQGGLEVLVVDCGVLGEPRGITPDISHERVAEAAGSTLGAVRSIGTRGAAVEIMARGLSRILADLHGDGRCGGVVALGGGALLRRSTRALVRQAGLRVQLEVAPEVALTRLKASRVRRPLLGELTGLEALRLIKRLFRVRKASYAGADLCLDTSGLSADAGARKIMEEIRHHACLRRRRCGASG